MCIWRSHHIARTCRDGDGSRRNRSFILLHLALPLLLGIQPLNISDDSHNILSLYLTQPLDSFIKLHLPFFYLHFQLGDPIALALTTGGGRFSISFATLFTTPDGCFLLAEGYFGVVFHLGSFVRTSGRLVDGDYGGNGGKGGVSIAGTGER